MKKAFPLVALLVLSACASGSAGFTNLREGHLVLVGHSGGGPGPVLQTLLIYPDGTASFRNARGKVRNGKISTGSLQRIRLALEADTLSEELVDVDLRSEAFFDYEEVWVELDGKTFRCVCREVVPQPAAAELLHAADALVRRHFRLYRLLTRESGQHLANERFMASLPVPTMPVRIYAGVSGPRSRLSPFGGEENDGILAVSETEIPVPNAVVVRVPSMHTFIMNSALVANDIVTTTRSLTQRDDIAVTTQRSP